MFDKIISYPNIEAAYLEIIEQFSSDRRHYKYHGIDNIFLHDIDLTSRKLIKIIRDDLLSKKEIEPALAFSIPKKNKPNQFREIFVYNLKERIKAQAIYRVVLPEFEKEFSHRLFSYRPNKPPYLAARIFCRRYRQNFLTDTALILDIKSYFDTIDRDIMLAKVKELFQDQDIIDLFSLFIFNKTYRDGVLETPEKGLVHGIPLTSLLANLYLTAVDCKYQKKAEFYVRVGDDIALLDSDSDKLNKIAKEMLEDFSLLKLEVNKQKMFLGPAKNLFSFLGYSFEAGLISLEKGFINKLYASWKKNLDYQHLALKNKQKLISRLMNRSQSNFNYIFSGIIKDKPQINDSKQIKIISEEFFKIMTKFFYEHYSLRNRRLLMSVLAPYKITSLYKNYQKFHYERR